MEKFNGFESSSEKERKMGFAFSRIDDSIERGFKNLSNNEEEKE